jgi:uncharacterized damage-inducible protein DinB
MSIARMLLPEYDQELATTRRVLARIPEDRLAWQPHPKSMSLGRLASHLAELAGFGALTITQDELNLASLAGRTPLALGSRQEILDLFDANVQKTRATIEATGDEAFQKPWTLRRGDQVFFSIPRVSALRTMLINHIIHHRGQLSVYLRLTDTPVPSIYGPTADEQV